jgi:Replication-relaxation
VRGRKGLGLHAAQIADFQRELRLWMAGSGHTSESLAQAAQVRAEYVRLLLGEYKEKTRAPSAVMLERLAGLGFAWTQVQNEHHEPFAEVISERAQREREVIEFLARAGAATREQLQQLFFPSLVTANRALALLTRQKVLRRFRPQVAGGAGLNGSVPFIYSLAPDGLKLAAQLLNRTVPSAWRAGQPAELFLAHRLQVTAFLIALIRGAGALLSDWRCGADLEDVVVTHGMRQRFVPDGYARLSLDWGERLILFEIDHGTMGAQAWREKAAAYQAYYRSGRYRERYGRERLLVVCVTTDARQRDLIARCWNGVSPILMLYLATWAEVEAHGVMGAPWLRYDTRERQSLSSMTESGTQGLIHSI